MRACLLEAFSKESFLGHRQAHFFGDRHCCANVIACSSSMGLILCTGAMVSIKNYRGVGVTTSHMSNVQSAYFSVCRILWPCELVKQPSSINDIPQACSGERRNNTFRDELD